MRSIILFLWNNRLIRSLGRFTLIGSVAFLLSTFFNWNSPKVYTQARNLLHGEKEVLEQPLEKNNLINHDINGDFSNIYSLGKIDGNSPIIITNCTSITNNCTQEDLIYISHSLQNISLDWLKENLRKYPYQLIYSLEKINTEEIPLIKGRIYTIDSLSGVNNIVATTKTTNFNNWKTILLFTGGFTTWITIETFLYRRQHGGKFSAQEIVQLQQQQNIFKEKIASLIKEINYFQENLANVKNNKKALQTLIAAKNAELEQVRKEAKEFEQYVLEENQFLEKENHNLLGENQELSLQLSSAKEEISHLQITLNKFKKRSLSQVLTPENLIETEEEFLLAFSLEAQSQLFYLAKNDQKKYKKVLKTLTTMSTNLRHNSLQTHEYAEFSGAKGEKVFESYVEHHTPGAWRVFWYYGPGQGFLTIDKIIPHP
jgi:hypothetical protein